MRNTVVSSDSLTPQFRFRLITENCPLWMSTPDECPLSDPYWAFYWPGGQAITKIMDTSRICDDSLARILVQVDGSTLVRYRKTSKSSDERVAYILPKIRVKLIVEPFVYYRRTGTKDRDPSSIIQLLTKYHVILDVYQWVNDMHWMDDLQRMIAQREAEVEKLGPLRGYMSVYKIRFERSIRHWGAATDMIMKYKPKKIHFCRKKFDPPAVFTKALLESSFETLCAPFHMDMSGIVLQSIPRVIFLEGTVLSAPALALAAKGILTGKTKCLAFLSPDKGQELFDLLGIFRTHESSPQNAEWDGKEVFKSTMVFEGYGFSISYNLAIVPVKQRVEQIIRLKKI